MEVNGDIVFTSSLLFAKIRGQHCLGIIWRCNLRSCQKQNTWPAGASKHIRHFSIIAFLSSGDRQLEFTSAFTAPASLSAANYFGFVDIASHYRDCDCTGGDWNFSLDCQRCNRSGMVRNGIRGVELCTGQSAAAALDSVHSLPSVQRYPASCLGCRVRV